MELPYKMVVQGREAARHLVLALMFEKKRKKEILWTKIINITTSYGHFPFSICIRYSQNSENQVLGLDVFLVMEKRVS